MEPILSVKDLSLTFPDGKKIFEQAELSLYPSETIGLWSPNGTGKTSLFRIITGLLLPQQGEVLLRGKLIKSEKDFRELRLRVGFVLQNSDDQLFFPQVIDDVAFGPLNQGLKEDQAKQVSEETLDKLGILNLKNSLSFELSGGQKKLVTLACVLSMRPDVLLLDEPTNGLDVEAKKRLVEVINRIEASKIIISHDPEVLSLTCSRFVTVSDYRIQEISKPDLHEHRHAHFFGQIPHSHDE